MIELPWSNKSKINTDLTNAQKILDEDHYGQMIKKLNNRVFSCTKKNTENERPYLMLSWTSRCKKFNDHCLEVRL